MVAAPQPDGDVDEGDEHGHLDEGSDDAGEGLAAGDAEDADRDGDRQFEVVAGGNLTGIGYRLHL